MDRRMQDGGRMKGWKSVWWMEGGMEGGMDAGASFIPGGSLNPRVCLRTAY